MQKGPPRRSISFKNRNDLARDPEQARGLDHQLQLEARRKYK